MTQAAIATIRTLPAKLQERGIRAVRGFSFDADWAENLIGYFTRECAAHSVEYRAALNLDGTVYNGTVEVSREGWLTIRRAHA